jgi:branched-chain amino acid transport system substrate-binding protein
MKRRIGLLLALLLLVGTTLPLRAADEPYDFYAILPITGPAAFLGRGEQVALTAVEKYINQTGGIRGRPLRIIAQDDQSNPAIALQIANQIIAKKVPAFVGPGFTATCNAVYPLVAANGPVMYCLSSGLHPPNGGYAFTYGLSSSELTAVVFRYWKSKGIKKIGGIFTTDATGQDGEEAAHNALKRPELAGMQLVAVEHFGQTDLAITAQITRLKASGAEAIDAWTSGTPLGTVLRGLHEIGWDPPVNTSLANAVPEQLVQYASFVPKELMMASLGYTVIGVGKTPPATRVAKATFLEAMHSIGVAEPSVPNVLPWDPMILMVSALRKYGTNATAQQVRDYILAQSAYAGANGVYNFTKTTASSEQNRAVDPMSSAAIRWDKETKSFPIVSKPGGGAL